MTWEALSVGVRWRPSLVTVVVTSLRHLVDELTIEITMLSEVTADLLAGDRGYQVNPASANPTFSPASSRMFEISRISG